MKSLHFMLIVLLWISTMAFAESDGQRSFDKLKTLAVPGKAPSQSTLRRRI